MEVYRFPSLTSARLFRESNVSYYLRALKYPNFDKPFTRLNLATMDLPPLLGLCLAQLRHRYSDYESRLAAGEDREMLHREIHAAAFHAYISPSLLSSFLRKNRKAITLWRTLLTCWAVNEMIVTII